MKLNPTTKPTGSPTVSTIILVEGIFGEKRIFTDMSIACEYAAYHGHTITVKKLDKSK